MRLEIFILGITIFFIYNAYHDGKYTKLLFSYKKYYQMAFFSIIGIGVYLLLKRNPVGGRQLLLHANNMVKYMPIDKSSLNMISPIFDFTENVPPSKMMTSGQNTSNIKNNRSVSGMKKKYVASIQNWKCGQCQKQLDYTYEVDHKIRLEHGGGNDVQNLIALCRECHGKKTVLETF
jgi:hypothetical protein